MNLRHIDAEEVAARLSFAQAVAALEDALRGGLDPEADTPRQLVDVDAGQLLVMPSALAPQPTVKVLSLGGDPRIQGVCLVFDRQTLQPVALVDGIAVTNVRTAAVSALAVKHLATPDAARLVIFGRGPQAHAHEAAVRAVRPITDVQFVGRDTPGRADLVAQADVICCCTTAREPLFDGALVADHVTVVAIGSHEAQARETDDILAARSTVVVESRTSALREAGDVIGALAAGALTRADLVGLADVVRGTHAPDPRRPRLFKSTGMSWEDAVIASALVQG